MQEFKIFVPVALYNFIFQLQARMERMERRLAILQKHRSKHDMSDSEPLQQHAENTSLLNDTPTSTPRIRTHRDAVVNSEKYSRSRSNSHDRIGRTGRSSRVSSQSGTPTPQDVHESGGSSTKRNAKRKLDDVGVEVITKKRRPRQNDMRTRLEYTGLNLPLPHQHCDGYITLDRLDKGESRRDSNDLVNSVASSSISGYSGMEDKAVLNGAENAILVPSWRTSSLIKPGMGEDEGCDEV